jgi:hypothetical protein
MEFDLAAAAEGNPAAGVHISDIARVVDRSMTIG